MRFLNIKEEHRKWWVLAAMIASISVIFIDISILPVTLPTLHRDLHISSLGLQWVVNSYTLALTVLVLAGGRLGDIWGLRKGFCFGISLFAFASILCGLSFSGWWLIASRILQGVGGAFLVPATQGLLIENFPPHQRGKAVGLMVSISSIFLALGPLIGGALTQYASWHYVFWINIPIVAIGLLLTLLVVPPSPKKKESFDWKGFMTLSSGITAIVIALMQSQSWGWLSLATLSLLTCGIVLCFTFFFTENKAPHPLIEMHVINRRSFLSGSSCIFTNQTLTMVTVYWAIYFQDILNLTPTEAGSYTFLANAPVLFAAPIAGWLVDRYGPRLPVTLGFSCIFFALAWFVAFSMPSTIHQLIPALIVFGCGIPLVFTPSFVTLMSEIPSDKRGIASGMNSTLRQFGATLGVALFGTLLNTIQMKRFQVLIDANNQTRGLSIDPYEGLLAQSPEATSAFSHLPIPLADYVFQSAKIAYVEGFAAINLCAALMAAAGIIIAFFYLKNRTIHHQ